MRWNRRTTCSAAAQAALLAAGLALLMAAAPAAQAPPENPPAAPPPAATAAPQAPATAALRFLVVIDPAHGGDETGVAFSPELLEKDLTLALARRLRAELANRGVAAILLRDGDFAIASDQRAAMTNADRASLYIALHAGAPGPAVRVYTAMLPPAASRPGAFLPWATAQAAYLDRSGALARSIVGELDRRHIGAAWLPGPVRPLNSIAAPAVAVEISPSGDDDQSMADPKYQQSVAAAVAAAVAARAGLGSAP
jgi:N-acetylmuramoyl-L-alanine amidase